MIPEPSPQLISAALQDAAFSAQLSLSVAAQLAALLGAEVVEDGTITRYIVVMLSHQRSLAQVSQAVQELVEEEQTTASFMAWLAQHLRDRLNEAG